MVCQYLATHRLAGWLITCQPFTVRDVSSAILYLAIIAIWALFLVPAWVRRPHARADHSAETDPRSSLVVETFSPHTSESFHDLGGSAVSAQGDPYAYDPYEADAGPDADERDYGESYAPAYQPVSSREQMLRARRRMLTILVAMTALTAAVSY